MIKGVDSKKIVVLGDPAVGKTSIIQRYIHNQFKESYLATLGFNIYTRYLSIGEKNFGLSIWDIGGQEAFKKFAFRYLVEADAAIFVTDVSRPETTDSLPSWNQKLEEVVNRRIPKIILFNKIDLPYDINVISDKVVQSKIRPELNGIVFASAKTGQNVTDIFSMIANILTNWDERLGIIGTRGIIRFSTTWREDCLPVVFFSSADCRWCKPVFNRITKLSEEFPLDIRVIDVETESELTKKHGVSSLPTMIIGSKTIVGNSDEEILRSIINDEYVRMV